MAHQTINILLTTFPGLGLPSTLVLQTARSCSIADLTSDIFERIPSTNARLSITTTSNKELSSSCYAPISSLLRDDTNDLIPLRLSVPLCGGKGGFGSQLRAAGGRMSSRRKRKQGENNGSNRNLDGRRLRTVTEAKALAEYLALKPEMEKKEKEARRKRWEQVVELTERREEELRTGAKGKVDGKWVEDKEEAGERTREAVLAAMRAGDYQDNLMTAPTGSRSSQGGSASSSEGTEDEDEDMHSQSSPASTPPSTLNAATAPSRKFFGFDEDEEFMSEEDDEKEDDQESQGHRDQQVEVTKGKGKQKA